MFDKKIVSTLFKTSFSLASSGQFFWCKADRNPIRPVSLKVFEHSRNILHETYLTIINDRDMTLGHGYDFTTLYHNLYNTVLRP